MTDETQSGAGSAAPDVDPHERSGPSPFLYVYVVGAILVLAGGVLPWLRGPRALLWAWDISIFWPLTGALGVLKVPPPVGAAALLGGVALATPIVFRRPIPVRFSAAIALALLVLAGLTIWRGLTFPGALTPHVGVIAVIAGSGLSGFSSIR